MLFGNLNMSNELWVTSDNVASSEIGDEVALLDASKNQYFTLNQAGSVVWRLLSDKHTAAELTHAVATEFGIEAAACEDDINELIVQLNEAGLIRKA